MEKSLNKYKVMAAFLCMACLCFSLSACSENYNAETEKKAALVNFSTIEREYLDAINELSWPEGYSLPTKLEGKEEITEFQAGWGANWASVRWEHAWMKEWLASYRTDAKRADAAIKELEKAFEMPYMNSLTCDDTTRALFRDRIDRAKLGDPSGFEESTRINCPK